MNGHEGQSAFTKHVPSAPPKKKAKNLDNAGIAADWESRRKPVPSMAVLTNSIDNESMVKQGGIASDSEGDNVERKAIANDRSVPKKGGKKKLVFFIRLLFYRL